ncbi:glycosyltransferase family 1 protein [Xylona heveae TC161]|uniref:Glycosyltransferase family 1 protein n=1 Tax=Xylona heveae (strain CBS 132557 / TC161) TaxID=1328760 RepID=A0A164ZD72_XYLHT|nr:glycosyltransferase family 1 protein [Xylona heveae TC161]KZF18953.1 glycosyltransferase family 1 protein [Xylona heveae TC161]
MATLRDADGSVVPTRIPPAIDFPYPDSDDEHEGPSNSSSFLDGTSPEKGIEADPAPKPPKVNEPKNSDPFRPAIRRWETERPPLGPTSSLFALTRRVTGGARPLRPWLSARGGLESDSDSLSQSSTSSTRAESPKPRRREPVRQETLDSQRVKKQKTDSDPYRKLSVGNGEYQTRGRVSKKDGRLNISLHDASNNGYLAKALGATIKRHFRHDNGEATQPISSIRDGSDERSPSPASSTYKSLPPPRLNIVIMVIGSRGDIQPFLRIGKLLKEEHGHRVRIATHPAFKKFIEQDSKLEFFSVGGDPAELMAFMVKNPGLIPSVATVKAGEIGRRRDQMFEMFQGFWRACINATDDEKDIANLKMMGTKRAFVADAIIANPPCFAHIHCAERLGVPLHLMFTFPYSPTQKFPHPLANIKRTNMDTNYTNFMSYPLVELMTWQGLGDLVNRFRVDTLGLEPVSTLWAPGQLYRLKVPYTYLWSPGLVPKPDDWGPEIDIAGFVFLDLASNFKPPDDLVKFLDAGPPPIYIGFGSIVIDDPDKFTQLIFEAVKKVGVRALVNKGWGGLGHEGNVPENIFMLDNTPHDWLFPKVRAVVHHGGAGTTAIGFKCGKPTMIVPFFGDQSFWGAMAARSQAGAKAPVPYKNLTVDSLAEGIKECLTDTAQENAKKLADAIAAEGDGARNAVESFHRRLPLRGDVSMRCSILHDQVASWRFRESHIRLSPLAAETLVERKYLTWKDLELLRHCEWNDFEGPGEPLTGIGSALFQSFAGAARGVGGVPVRLIKKVKQKRHLLRRLSKKHRRSARSGKPPEAVAVKRQAKGKPKENGEANAVSNGGIVESLPPSHQGRSNVLEALQNNLQGLDSNDSNDVSNDVPDHFVHELAHELAQDIATETSRGLGQTGAAIAKAPMNFLLALGQGFHNAPRLYGDKTVRRAPRITGFKSGMRAAGGEFVYGIWDGWTGVVMQPYNGARKSGTPGFAKGVARGVGGFVLKDISAIVGPFGYALKGIHKEMVKDRYAEHSIRRARIIEGQKQIRHLTPQGKERIFARVRESWDVVDAIRQECERTRKQGIRGRARAQREKRKWEFFGAFENVDQADKALKAKHRGTPFDRVFRKHRQEIREAQDPRTFAMNGNGHQVKMNESDSSGLANGLGQNNGSANKMSNGAAG